MIKEGTDLVVADNTGAKRVRCFRILKQRKKYARIGDLIKVAVKDAEPDGTVKKHQVCTAIVVRTRRPIRRSDGSYISFDDNAVVILDNTLSPIGTRVFGPVPRELRDINQMKIISLAPEVV